MSRVIDYKTAKLTEKEVMYFEMLEKEKCKIIANEDLCKVHFLFKGRKIKTGYSFYLKLWYKGLLQCIEDDIDNCIFTYTLIHQ